MAKFCTKCGSKLVDGKCPNCENKKSEVPTTGFDMNEMIEVVKGMFTKPVDTIKEVVENENITISSILIGINAIIIAFNVRPNALAKEAAEKEEVEIKQYSVIYQAIEDVEAAMKGMLDPEFEEKVIGTAEIRQVFRISSVGNIAGAYVLNGKIERHSEIRVIRDDVVIHSGELASLKRFKDDVKEVTKGFECGIQIKDYNDLKEGDILECYVLQEIKR